MLFKTFIAVATIFAHGGHAINAMKPLNSVNQVAKRSTGKQTTAGKQKLAYVGGNVKTNIDIQPILWPNAARGSKGAVANASKIVQFYQGITNSTYMDWLSECKC